MATKMNTNDLKPFKIIKLDRRYTGHEDFKFAINYLADYRWKMVRHKWSPHRPKITFMEHRNWFWEMYGPSADISSWIDLKWMHDFEPKDQEDYSVPLVTAWAWNSDHGHLKIYVKDEAVLSHFIMVHQLDKYQV